MTLQRLVVFYHDFMDRGTAVVFNLFDLVLTTKSRGNPRLLKSGFVHSKVLKSPLGIWYLL